MASQKPETIVKATAEDAAAAAAELIKAVVRESVAERGRCHLALAGGTTPHLLYKMLARGVVTGDVPWQDVEVFFSDERDVPPDHIESNYGMIQRALLDNLPVPPNHIHPMPADWLNLDAAAEEYERAIRALVPSDGMLPRFDLILLGLGTDGHTASLFPHTAALTEVRRLVLSQYVPFLGRKRMTFTFPLINAARHVVMLATGEDKTGPVADLLGPHGRHREELPAARVNPTDGRFTIILDEAAARRISN
ncbi:MAG: 6-phosphogluconolactonase [Planctomycetota bacterium]|nr:6-phosphogluconolactonase [Planctomycetota bacterium]